ncbi:putative reverse transcriptase domain-containing protein [Tanacetum coccineum]
MFRGKQIVLVPNKPKGISAPMTQSPSPITLLSRAPFEATLEESGVVFFLLSYLVSHDTHVVLPTDVQPLLHEFVDVFPESLLSDFPHLHDIQHHIDLVPGAVLPNRPHYRMSLKEHEELRRQVEEFANPAVHLDHLHEVLLVLHRDKFYAATIKCAFLKDSVQFLGYVVSRDGLKVNPSKVLTVEQWPQPSSITKFLSFHANAPFYEIKRQLTSAPILVLPNFTLPFELHCDASKTGISVVLSQSDRLVVYFSEKL